MKKPHIWDNYSDQPEVIKDKKYKKNMRSKSLSSLVKTVLISLFILPFSIVMMPFVRRKQIDSSLFFCMGVDYQREPELSLEILKELDLKRVLLRIKLWEMESLDELKEFVSKIENKKITIGLKSDENYAYITIEDNGGGIPKDVISKIFDSYFTTKLATHGTGIGLYMSKNIIEKNMSGELSVKNSSSGACFTIKLPLANQ